MYPAEYSRDYLVHYYEIDRRRKLSLPALIHYFEDIAVLHSEARGYTLDHYRKTGRVFLLLKWDIAVRYWPAFNETLRIATRPTAFRKFLANRDFTVFGSDGTALAEARSLWIFTDMGAKKPARVPEDMYDGFGVSRESEASFDAMEELEGSAGGPDPLKITVGTDDLDNNGHVNNVRYVEWALWSLPPEFLSSHEASRIRVQYRRELCAGEEAVVHTEIAAGNGGPRSAHAIRSGDLAICDLRIEWREA